MKNIPTDNDDSPSAWSTELKTAFDRPRVTDEVRSRLLQRADRSPSRVAFWHRPLYPASVLILGGLLVFAWRVSAPPARNVVGTLVVASETEPLELYRENDSAFVLASGAKGRIDALDRTVVRLSLLHGRATGQIHASNERPWQITSGTFTLKVRGAHFELESDANPSVRVLSGTLSLEGPCGPPQILETGTTSLLSCPENSHTPPVQAPSIPNQEIRAAPRTKPSLRTAAPPTKDDRLRDEIDLVERMRAALDVDPAQTLKLAKEGMRTFPGGMLGEEREAMTILALNATGRHDEARRRATLFVKTFPSGTFAHRIRVILNDPEAD